jgi:hypothetical protein
MMTLPEALKTGKIDQFVKQEEAFGARAAHEKV